MTTNGCTGLCCAAFRIPLTRRELRAKRNTLEDADQILDMLIPLTPKEARERNQEFGDPDAPDGHFPWSDRGHNFTCRHWDESTRLCGIYPDRPKMCRKFPYGKKCPFGCSCKAG